MGERHLAEYLAFRSCIPTVKGTLDDPENLQPVVSEDEVTAQQAMLSPFGEVVGRYDDTFTLKGCLFVIVSLDQDTRGTVYFLIATPSKGMEVSAIQWAP